ncbi:MAG TPA: rhodanese-like domain-containing protein [Candidatus Udaeobacter sp.]|jgi:glyoxylase-like metal-dependent hydrolase (beta-lactamase superfamily II)/rhodanese-related sulfurtransferase|nr:rhodanese-like domain-containing protein [Candidatus Udaeobacter sp.]
MHFKQFYVGCLAHASYLIGDGGEAVVVDPSRDIERYLAEAKAHRLTIRWVLETHLHADFVSGHRDLAAATGAVIGIGAQAEAAWPHRALKEGDEIRVGDVVLRAIETPGHTPEHLSFVIFEHAGDVKPWGVLTGDTLFVGDVGRVDILSSRLPVQELAGLMYDSLHRKLLALPDETRVYPAHGAGSLCGRSISKDSWSTIGRERQMNAALRPMTREAFVAEITRDVPETPVYFLHSRDLNRTGPKLAAERAMPPALGAAAFDQALRGGALVLDTRDAAAYAAAHIPSALHVGLDGQYASWVGTLVEPAQSLLLVTDDGREEEAVMRLERVGYENVLGTLAGGIAAWRDAGLPLKAHAIEPAGGAIKPGRRILDVRRPGEWSDGHIDGALHVPLSHLSSRAAELDRDGDWLVVCAGGYRSSIAASVLERAGFTRVTEGEGGVDALRRAGVSLLQGT